MTTEAERDVRHDVKHVRAPVGAAEGSLEKVPPQSLGFWVGVVLCAPVGAASTDLLDGQLSLGLIYVSYLMAGLLAVALTAQLSARRYLPLAYWTVMVLAAVCGTLFAEDLVTVLGLGPVGAASFVTIVLSATFVTWRLLEGRVRARALRTRREEGLYWLAVVASFALGTALEDVSGGPSGFGDALLAMTTAGLLVLLVLAVRSVHLPPTQAFWTALVLTVPLGASLAEMLGSPLGQGGPVLGVSGCGVVALAAVVVVVSVTEVARRHRGRASVR